MDAALTAALKNIADGKPAAFYLVVGDEFLVRQSADALCHALIAEKDRGLNMIRIDASAGAAEIAGELGTVPMFRGRKAVVVEGAEALAEEKDAEAELSRARELWAAPGGKRQRDATRRLLTLVRPSGWEAADVALGQKGAASASKWKKEIGAAPTEEDRGWLQELAAYAAEKRIVAPPADVERLVAAVESAPPGNVLVLCASELSARDPLARLAEKRGVALSCKVQRRGREIGTLELEPLVKEVLDPLGKRLSGDAMQLLKERVGDHARALQHELAKLADYSGDRATITGDDVMQVVERYQEAEFFALGNAVAEGNLGAALKLLDAEMARAKNPTSVALPFLGGIAGAVRRLLMDAARVEAIPGAAREMSYNTFQANVFPAVAEDCRARGQKAPNPYGSYLSMQRARKRGRARLAKALAACARADVALKSGADPRRAVESLLAEVCL